MNELFLTRRWRFNAVLPGSVDCDHERLCSSEHTDKRREEESWAVTHSFFNSTLKTSREKPVFKSASGTMSFSPPLSNPALFALSILALRSLFFPQPSSLVFYFAHKRLQPADSGPSVGEDAAVMFLSARGLINELPAASGSLWNSASTSHLPPPSRLHALRRPWRSFNFDSVPLWLLSIFPVTLISLWSHLTLVSCGAFFKTGVQPKSNTRRFSKCQPVLKPGWPQTWSQF